MNNESKVKTAELYAASEKERESLIDWYKDHSSVELHDDGINTLCQICPPDEYGENEDCEALQNIIRVMFYRITKLEAENKELMEALKNIMNVNDNNLSWGTQLSQVVEIAGKTLSKLKP